MSGLTADQACVLNGPDIRLTACIDVVGGISPLCHHIVTLPLLQKKAITEYMYQRKWNSIISIYLVSNSDYTAVLSILYVVMTATNVLDITQN